MKITLVTVGKIKERFFEDAIAEYSKRLGRYCKLEIIQVADEKTPDGASENVERQIREKEGQRILAQIKDGAYVLALAIEGKMLSSEELAGKTGSRRQRPSGICHRWIPGTFQRGDGPGRLCPQFLKNDISAPADAGDTFGADLQRI